MIREQKPQRALALLAFRVPLQQSSYSLHIVSWKHACVTGPFNGAIHPAIVNLLHIDYGITILEGDLIFISCTVIIDCTKPFLGEGEEKKVMYKSMLRNGYSQENARCTAKRLQIEADRRVYFSVHPCLQII